ncbi:MAG: LytTR family transcriptional regulator [Lachnospiraceae bacterium]|nr:LytTR family transcriptional regulator [Lachnospiraceae bacterium]
MVSMVVVDANKKEIVSVKDTIKDVAARLTEDEWKIEMLGFSSEEMGFFQSHPLVDMCCYDILPDGSLEYLTKLRREYSNMGLMLIADATVSPLVYLKPGIRADSLLMRPFHKDVLRSTMEEFVSAYLSTVDSQDGVSSFVIDSKEGKINIPYSDIYYFEAREKKIFARTLNDEYGFYATMEQMEEKLPDTFIRCHRSFIVSKSKIKKIMLSQNLIELLQGFDVPLSRSYKPVLKQFGK